MLPMLLPVVRAIRRAIRSNLVMFGADLKTSIVPEKAVVSTPTFTRASSATVIDFEGLIKTAKSGEVRFHGARRVENLLTFTEDFNNAAWSKIYSGTGVVPNVEINYGVAPDGTLTADRVQLDKGAGSALGDYSGISQIVSTIGVRSIYLKTNDDSTKNVTFRGASTTVVSVTGIWKRFSLADTTEGTQIQIILRGTYGTSDSCDLLVWGAQMEFVKGQTNQNPSEYVSKGVLSAPYHGAGADGVQYFDYENGNTVTSNIVTEAQGTPITDSLLRGYLAEEQRTNLVLQSQNHATTWTAVGTPTITSANKNYGTLVLDLLGDNDAAAVEGYKQNISFTGNAQKSVSFRIKQGTATKSVIRLRDTTAGADRLNVEITWSGSTPVYNYVTGAEERPHTALNDGVYEVYALSSSVTATNTNSLEVYPATDNILAVLDTGNINIGGWQVENALTASSYIPTTTATVTRAADALSYDVANIDNTQGTIIVEFEQNWSGTPSVDRAIIGNGTDPILYHDGLINFTDGTNTATIAAATKVGISWGAAGLVLTDGVNTDTVTFDESLNISSFQIGYAGANNHLNGTIKDMVVYEKPKTAEKLASLL